MLKYILCCLPFLLVANATFYVNETEAVCGSDFRTYSSKHELECVANCTQDPDLVVDEIGECIEPCMCTKEHNPVCANNGETYGNICQFNCALKWDSRLAIISHGACCDCMKNVTKKFEPVCGTNGITYFNQYVLRCAKKYNSSLCIASDGVCPCLCPEIYSPVCGNNNSTYGNYCELNCAKKSDPNIRVLYEGPCTKVCYCTFIYEPVCGTDGNTYSNECLLNCAKNNYDSNLMVKCHGPC